ncbi:hypothetical protein ELQ35_05755 [Peribacillus cavernae]|uniref:Spore germination GerAC-like C-terminal domain-containing protein n=1 Tax=Peribacillus cavernae TaxID=1674310 RepID=A0A3S0U675_9BACI|nr:Ger(x)C family spore germination C-terminal domain-containing protein [Peribacillus cavernae]MDQ0220620.1 hypothetical protein [Peribacillus cavernae]RUQ31084.1 hypothetical protein ELQ35_05755 [Peribacillus cavernae]
MCLLFGAWQACHFGKQYAVRAARLDEYKGQKNLNDPKELRKLNNEIEAYLNQQTKDLFKKMQQLKVDPLQVGTRSLTPFTKPMNDKEWMSYWRKMLSSESCEKEWT